jgi:ribosomal protein L17
MDFFTKVGESLTNLGQGVNAKAKNMMDQSAMNSQLRQHETALKGLYENIGRQYYAEKQGKGEGAYAELFEQIATTEAAAEEVRKKLDAAKSMVTCPKCGGLTEAGGRFCKNCGNAMPEGNPGTNSTPQS